METLSKASQDPRNRSSSERLWPRIPSKKSASTFGRIFSCCMRRRKHCRVRSIVHRRASLHDECVERCGMRHAGILARGRAPPPHVSFLAFGAWSLGARSPIQTSGWHARWARTHSHSARRDVTRSLSLFFLAPASGARRCGAEPSPVRRVGAARCAPSPPFRPAHLLCPLPHRRRGRTWVAEVRARTSHRRDVSG